jgi:hypothetical protein
MFRDSAHQGFNISPASRDSSLLVHSFASTALFKLVKYTLVIAYTKLITLFA